MLGIDSKELPVVEGQYAIEMHEALKRVRSGQLNDFDKHVEEHSVKVRKRYDIIWG